MKQHIVYKIQKKSGGVGAIKIVPITIPGFNNRTSINGVFQLFYFLPNDNPRTAELDMDTYMGSAGAITFLNENFFEWRYDGQILVELEVAQLVKIIQDHVEEWFDEADNQPVLREEDLHDPESAFYMSDAQLTAIMEHPLYDISPYFLFGPDDDVIGIVQNGSGFDIHNNGKIAAHLEVSEVAGHQIINGEIQNEKLVTEIVRRIRAVREL
jgi:hypothetical protein